MLSASALLVTDEAVRSEALCAAIVAKSSCSCVAYHLTILTRFGISSALWFSSTSIFANDVWILLRKRINLLYVPNIRDIMRIGVKTMKAPLVMMNNVVMECIDRAK